MTMICTETKVLVEDLRLEAYVGLHAPERDQLQTIAIDIICTLVDPKVTYEELETSVDYVPIVEEVRRVATTQKRRLIETLAEEIAEICLKDTNTGSVVVSVRKPHKFSGIKAVGITRTFKKGEQK